MLLSERQWGDVRETEGAGDFPLKPLETMNGEG